MPASAVMAWLRQSGRDLADPCALGLPAAPSRRGARHAIDDLLAALLAGDEPAARAQIMDEHRRGAWPETLADGLIGPVFGRIGDGWASGRIPVHQERRACQVMLAVLHELRRWLPPPMGSAPLAMAATPGGDFAETPLRLVELVLLSRGWRVEVIGAGLPLDEIRASVLDRQPRLLCLSVTHLADTAAFVASYNQLLTPEVLGAPVIVGGSALRCEASARLRCEVQGARLADLAAWLDQQEVTPRSRGRHAPLTDTEKETR